MANTTVDGSVNPGWPREVLSVTGDGMVEIRYVEQSPVVVRGPVTGRTYQFSSAAPIQKVHGSDAEALIRTRFFRLR
jgi:hypothetical protein